MSEIENPKRRNLEAALAKTIHGRSLRDRVLVAASDDSRAELIGEKFPELVATQMREVDRVLHRRGVSLVLLMGVFVLFANANITELEFGGVRLADATPIYRLLPLGIAIYYSE